MFGVLLGSVLMYFYVFKDRDIYKSPQQVITEKLEKGKFEYTKHGACRMDCRGISEAEIKDILKNGDINYKKSDVHGKPCPSYAYEGRTNDGQEVRIVFGSCDSITKLITAIDLKVEKDTCDCP